MNTATEIAEKAIERKLDLTVTYNGINKKFEAVPHETVRMLLDRAIQSFGITQNVHLLGLFTQDGRELTDSKTLKEEGVKTHDHLLLRPSVVRGG